MAFGMYFTPASFTREQYDQAITKLEAAGAGAPAGRLFHVALDVDGGVHIFDVWESMELFEEFGKALMPILSELNVDPGQPQVSPVHNIVEG